MHNSYLFFSVELLQHKIFPFYQPLHLNSPSEKIFLSNLFCYCSCHCLLEMTNIPHIKWHFSFFWIWRFPFWQNKCDFLVTLDLTSSKHIDATRKDQSSAQWLAEVRVQIPAGSLSWIHIKNWVFRYNTSLWYSIKYCNHVMGGVP